MTFEPPVPTTMARLLRRLNAAQVERQTRERVDKDFAIEFGEYLANAAEKFMLEQNRAAEAEEMPNVEHWMALQSAIYEFRKRAEKVRLRHGGGSL